MFLFEKTNGTAHDPGMGGGGATHMEGGPNVLCYAHCPLLKEQFFMLLDVATASFFMSTSGDFSWRTRWLRNTDVMDD